MKTEHKKRERDRAQGHIDPGFDSTSGTPFSVSLLLNFSKNKQSRET